MNNNLKNGILKIGQDLITPKTTLKDMKNTLPRKDIEIEEIFDEEYDRKFYTVDYVRSVKIGSKYFSVSIYFGKNKIDFITLLVDDPTIGEWDVWEKEFKHREWLIEEVGESLGIKDEIKFDWGSISIWIDDKRSFSAGISIYYNN